MTLKRARQRLIQIVRFSNYPFMPGDKAAMNICIEAAKRVESDRTWSPDFFGALLTGETKE